MNMTHWFLLAVGLVLLAYTLWSYFGKPPRISETIWDLGKKFPLVPFLFGVLMGHFCWPAPAIKGAQEVVIEEICFNVDPPMLYMKDCATELDVPFRVAPMEWADDSD